MPAKIETDFREEEVLQAIIIADSFDTKFHPLTLDTPKVLIPFMNVPLIEHVLNALQSSGIQESFIFCCHQTSKVKAYYSSSKWTSEKCKMKVRLIISDNCSSLGDALRDISNKNLIRSDFVLLHGDTIFNTNLLPILKSHKERKQLDKNITLTMILKDVGMEEPLRMEEKFLMLQDKEKRILNCKHVDKSGKGFMETSEVNADSTLVRFNILDCQVFICSPVVLHLMTDNFDYQSINDLLKGILVNEEVMGNSIYYHSLENNEYISRVWSFQSYGAVAMDVLNRWTYPMVVEKNMADLNDENYSFHCKNIYLHAGLNNFQTAGLVRNVLIGKNTSIGNNTVISDSVIGINCKIGNNVKMEGCFIFDNVIIEDGCTLSKCFVSNSACLHENVVIPRGCVIGSNVKVFSSDSLSSNTRLVSSSMNGTLEPLSSKKGGYVYFTGSVDVTSESKCWDWGEIIEESETSSFGESDSDGDEYDDSKLCYNELIKNLKRSITENVSMQNVILEMNSAKHAYGIQIGELHILLMRALLDLPNKLTSFAPEATNYFSRFGKLMKQLLPLLRHYIKSREAERAVLVAMEEACETEPDVLKSFAAVIKYLYDEDILSEEEIIAWWRDDASEHMPELEDKMAPLINWLETADEEDSDEDSD